MGEHKFGGDWTEDKLFRLAKYLRAYQQIFTQNGKALYFKTWYVDAFAGTGSRAVSGSPATGQHSVFDDIYEDAETTRYPDGSAKIALALPQPFDAYLLIEKSKSPVRQLRESIRREHDALLLRCDFRHGDANTVLKAWCK